MYADASHAKNEMFCIYPKYCESLSRSDQSAHTCSLAVQPFLHPYTQNMPVDDG